jgi:phage RecT family recombinase
MSKLVSVIGELPKLKEKFGLQNRWGLKFEQECLFAKQQLQKNSYTLEAAQNSPDALRSAILNVAAIGISLNPATAHAYLVPRAPAKGQAPVICLDISYRGLVKLATDSGAIQWAKAVLVYNGDEFKWRGPAEPPLHEADVFASDRIDPNDPLKNLKGGYCLAKLSTGEYMVDVMTAGEILAVRDSSKAANGPWKGKWAGEMAKKTLVKRASKSWPQTDTRGRFDNAVEIVNQHEGLEETSADERTIHEFMDVVAEGNPVKLLAHMQKLSEQEQIDCFNAAPKGEKTKLKERVRDLTKEAHAVIDDYCTQIAELAEGTDPACLDLYDELEEHERALVDARMTDITHRQLEAIRQEAAA